ncbi:MAG: DUF1559 domain-containing protein [Planctomycetaceae bacterium]|nr:DUF1559 domain-containing protein [Planctomycetaceae bacterium]
MRDSGNHQRRLLNRRPGFSILELVVVLIVIIFMMCLLLPALVRLQDNARASNCANKLRQLGIALYSYSERHGAFPPGYLARDVDPLDPPAKETGPGYAWGTLLLADLDQTPLLRTISLRGDAAISVIGAGGNEMDIFICPLSATRQSIPIDQPAPFLLPEASYIGCYGIGDLNQHPGAPRGAGAFYRNSYVRPVDVRDGLSTTFAIFERNSRTREHNLDCRPTWYAVLPGAQRPAPNGTLEGPADLALGTADEEIYKFGRHSSLGGFSSAHWDYVPALRADGSTTLLSIDIDPQTLFEQMQIEDGARPGPF